MSPRGAAPLDAKAQYRDRYEVPLGTATRCLGQRRMLESATVETKQNTLIWMEVAAANGFNMKLSLVLGSCRVADGVKSGIEQRKQRGLPVGSRDAAGDDLQSRGRHRGPY